MSDETIRQIIITVVVAVLVVRTPFMVRDRRQRPLWLMLLVFAGGSLVIQSWFGAAINRATGVAQVNNLVQGLWGVLSMAVTLEFVSRLAGKGQRSRRWDLTRIAAALTTAAAMALFFALTPPPQRFTVPHGFTTFTMYALTAAIYMITTAVAVVWLLCRHLRFVRTRTLSAALVLLAVGNATQVPFMTIRTVQRLSGAASPGLLDVAFILNTTRFILVPIGCVIAAMEPVRKASLYCYRRARLYGLWRRLRSATPELQLSPDVSRASDLLAFDDAWERLHRRVVEIRDSMLYLHDTWASHDLLNAARQHVEDGPPAHRPRLLTIACWLEVTRRLAVTGRPRVYADVDRSLLPDLRAARSTMHPETRYLLRLHRALRSRAVRDFADRHLEAGAAPAAAGSSR
ncbi:MAB_1171c family putative transporter [Krasilnikovia sp. M28-CT-15]|uniref:MAB_1171c family putative transporter n=1 Tax=Krasilnikovia sp. M28-CT-15 TaxID=3373540 RepID=UPI0038775FE3